MPEGLRWPWGWVKWPREWPKEPQGHPKCGPGWAECPRGQLTQPQAAAARPRLTLISICSSISLFLMAAYSFSSLQGTGGRAGTRGRGQAPTRASRGDPARRQEPVSPLHLLGVVLDLEGPEDELVGAAVELVRDHLLEVLRAQRPPPGVKPRPPRQPGPETQPGFIDRPETRPQKQPGTSSGPKTQPLTTSRQVSPPNLPQNMSCRAGICFETQPIV